MITDLLFTCAILLFLGAAFTRPYIALCLVVFVDTVRPHTLSSSFLAGQSLYLYSFAFLFVSVFFNMSKIRAPEKTSMMWLLILFFLWVSFTSSRGWDYEMVKFKYDIVLKTFLFVLLFPLLIDARHKLECFLWVFAACLGFFVMVAGGKVLTGGGGYGMAIIQTTDLNSGLLETSTFSTMTMVLIPVVLYLIKHSTLVQEKTYLKRLLQGFIALALIATIGTFARTGMVAGAVLFVLLFLESKKKMKMIGVVFLGLLAATPFLSEEYVTRMSTVQDVSQESSALGRIVVWRWTWDFVKENPYGGGFYAYRYNAGQLQKYVGEGEFFEPNEKGKAFHSIIFEVLGEHGFPGLGLFLFLIVYALSIGRKIYRDEKFPDWQRDMAKMISFSLIVYCVGGLFVGIAYLPYLYFLIFILTCIANVKPSSDNNVRAQ